MYLKNSFKRLLVLNVYIRSAKKDFQSLKTLEELTYDRTFSVIT